MNELKPLNTLKSLNELYTMETGRMQITHSPTLVALTQPDLLATPKTAEEAALTTAPAIATNQTSPSTLVTLTVAGPTQPLVYEPAKEIIQMRRAEDAKPAAASMTRQLSSDLTNLRAGKTDFSVSRLFSQLGSLSRETADYSNEARSQRAGVAGTKAADFTSAGGSTKARVSFSLRTKEGDQIDVFVEHTGSVQGDGLSFSFKVTGKLSVQEQKALEALAGKLGDVADQFFRSGTTELHDLREFDESQFASFHIEMSKPKDDKLVTQSYDYRVDETGRHLNAKDAAGYELTLDAGLLDFLNRNSKASSEALQAYISTITDALNDYETSTESTRFIRDAFSTLFASNTAITDTKSPDTLATFATGLPDFTATISAPLHHNRHNYLYPESLELQLAQHTQVEDDGENLKVTQTNSYELHSSKIKSPITDPDKKAADGNFTYSTRNEKRSTTRELSMTGEEIKGLLVSETEDVDNRDNKLVNFVLMDVQEEKYQREKLTSLLSQIADRNTAYNGKLTGGQPGKISPAQLQILRASRADLLAHIPG